MPKRILALLTLTLVVAATGCQSKHHDLVAFLDANEHEVSAIEYRVGIPDGITISAPQLLEIDRVTQRVRPDGKIALRLLGPVKVVGLTEKEIAAKLARLLEPYYEDPKVQVRVTEYSSKVIYLSGQVGGGSGGGGGMSGGTAAADRWASRPYTGRDTVMDVLADSGLSFIAWRSKVHVIRASPKENERRIIVIDVDHMISTGDISQNVLLQPGDILHVPATPLGWLGLRIQEVLFPFSPVLEGYQTPARVMDASDEYKNDD